MYFPLQNTCAQATSLADKPSLDSLYAIRTTNQIAPGTDKVGTIHAISVETGATLWKYEQRAGTTSLVATGGGLLFGGDAAGRFRAFDQQTGKVLWEVNLGSQVTGYPVTYAVGWPPVRRREYRQFAGDRRRQRPDPGSAPWRRQQSVRVRAGRVSGARTTAEERRPAPPRSGAMRGRWREGASQWSEAPPR